MDKRGMTTVMMVLEILLILIASYSIFNIASQYASSDTTNKIILIEDIKMMIDTLIGTPGDAVVRYPGDVSGYTLILGQSSISGYLTEQGEGSKLTRYVSLPDAYQGFGTLQGESSLCLEKKNNKIILGKCGELEAQQEQPAPDTTSDTTLPAPEGPSFYGIPITGDRIVFVVDRSSSMGIGKSEWDFPEYDTNIEPNGDTKLDAAVWQFKVALEQLPDGKYFNVIFFNQGTGSTKLLYDGDQMLASDLIALNAQSRGDAYGLADSLTSYGGTNLYDPLQKALSFENVDTIFLLTDGRPSLGVIDTDTFVSQIQQNNVENIRINTIGVFAITGRERAEERQDKELGIELLRRLAETNGGTFVQQKEGE